METVSGRKYTRAFPTSEAGAKQALIFGYLPATMQPIALWSMAHVLGESAHRGEQRKKHRTVAHEDVF